MNGLIMQWFDVNFTTYGQIEKLPLTMSNNKYAYSMILTVNDNYDSDVHAGERNTDSITIVSRTGGLVSVFIIGY